MKKLLKLSLLIFIPIIIGFALLLFGIFAANEGIRYAGIMTMTIGVPVCMFIVVVTGLYEEGEKVKVVILKGNLASVVED